MEKDLDLKVLNIENKDAETIKAIKYYLEDEFFTDLINYLNYEDYAMAKDATKGLYILAQELKLFRIYERLLDIYEDLDAEFYDDLYEHHRLMIEEYNHLKEVYKNV